LAVWYVRGNRSDDGLLRQYLLKVTSFSPAQVARCITQFAYGRYTKDRRHAPPVPLVRRYMAGAIYLLAQVTSFSSEAVPANSFFLIFGD